MSEKLGGGRRPADCAVTDPLGTLVHAPEGPVGNCCPASRSGDLVRISRRNERKAALLLERCRCYLLLSLLLDCLSF